jgi:DNA-binding NarL/FixJ family response regulator
VTPAESTSPDSTSPDEPIRVLLADDHPMFREGLAVALSALPGVEVVAEASSGEEAITAASRLQPDVVVMDVNMPGVNGIEATRRIVAESPHIGVLVLTMFDEDESVFQAMRAGARGYLLKGADRADILRAVHAVGRGDAIFGPALARRLIGYFSSGRAGAAPFADLTEREREVLELVARGKSNAEIARQLMISAKTVRNHVSNVFAKLQVSDRAQAIIRAREAGLGSPG